MKVNLENFSDKDINHDDVYFFTIGKSPPHDDDDEQCFDFNLVYKSEATCVYNNMITWKMTYIDAITLGDNDENTNLVFQFYKTNDKGVY